VALERADLRFEPTAARSNACVHAVHRQVARPGGFEPVELRMALGVFKFCTVSHPRAWIADQRGQIGRFQHGVRAAALEPGWNLFCENTYRTWS
jgi:hypothetical protein